MTLCRRRRFAARASCAGVESVGGNERDRPRDGRVGTGPPSENRPFRELPCHRYDWSVAMVRAGNLCEPAVLFIGVADFGHRENTEMLGTILLIILILLLIGALPTWPYSRSWGYYPTGGLGLILIIILVLLLMGRI